MNTHPDYATVPGARHLVLIGGGHTHALVLLQLAQRPYPDTRVTLISEADTSPYSGMLPGMVAGHYAPAEAHIALRPLCALAKVRLLVGRVVAVNAMYQQVQLESGESLDYDLLSINSGATPDLEVEGAGEHAIAVKPIATFWPRWLKVREALARAERAHSLAVVGGGAGSVELALAMAQSLRPLPLRHHIRIVTRGPVLLEDYPLPMRRWLAKRLIRHGVVVSCAAEVTRVGLQGLVTGTGARIAADHVFWCTQARGARWLAASGLPVTPRGFLRVSSCLQSLGDNRVFAAGDCAWIEGENLPRAGVYAVRQAPVLYANLQARLQGNERLQSYQPQSQFLSLLATGDKDAVGARGAVSLAGPWVWHLKDYIDRRFMAQFPAAQDTGL